MWEAWIAEAVQLRSEVDMPIGWAPGPADLRDLLTQVRARQDRVDELVVNTTRLRAAASRAAVAAKAELDDKWDAAAARVPASDFQTGRDRQAQINLLIVGTARAARQADEKLSRASEAVDVLRVVQRSLDGFRIDVHRLLQALTIEQSLER